ncbi:type 4a pilus biogenesis protein PilO [Candidatus Omnitrophota bacterium]
MDLKDILNKSNLKNQKDLIFIVIVVLVTAFLGKKVWEIQKAQLYRTKKEIEVYEEKMSLSDDINLKSKKIEEFRSLGWLTEESITIMGTINDLAGKHSIEIITFDPAGLKKNKNFSVFSMKLNIRSKYFSLARFLLEVEELKTLTKIATLEITPERNRVNEDDPMVKTKLSLKAFIAKK